MPSSKLKIALAEVLQAEGYITSFESTDNTNGPGSTLTISMKYSPERQRVINGLKRVSKPGLRVYTKTDQIPRVLGGLGVAVLSTSKGLLTDRAARKAKIGGESALLRLVGVTEPCHELETPPSPSPSGVEVSVSGSDVSVKGPKGTLGTHASRRHHRVNIDDGEVSVGRGNEQRQTKALARTQPVADQQHDPRGEPGVPQGPGDHRRRLSCRRPKVRIKLELALGFSHPVSRVQGSRRHRVRRSRTHQDRCDRYRQAGRRPGGRRDPGLPQTRAVQGQGCPLRR